MEKISDENLQRGMKTFFLGCETTIGATQANYLYHALCELQERRAADNKPLDADTIIKSLQKTDKPVLFVTAENRALNGYFSGDIGDLLAMVEFTFEKIEKESDGEITKYDLIETLANEEASE